MILDRLTDDAHGAPNLLTVQAKISIFVGERTPASDQKFGYVKLNYTDGNIVMSSQIYV